MVVGLTMNEARCLNCFEQFQEQKRRLKNESPEDLSSKNSNLESPNETLIIGRRRLRHINIPRQIKPETNNNEEDPEIRDKSRPDSEEIENFSKETTNFSEFNSKLFLPTREDAFINTENREDNAFSPVNKRARLLVQENEFD